MNPLIVERGEHNISPRLMGGEWTVNLVGAGGNGSHIAFGLARLHVAMLELGHPQGLNVTIWDDDRVSESNVGRQLYARADIGQYKAVVLCHRINTFYGLNFKPKIVRYGTSGQEKGRCSLLISCVDSGASRRMIHHTFWGSWAVPDYWLDLGNDEQKGQFFIGEPYDGQIGHLEAELQRKGRPSGGETKAQKRKRLELLKAEDAKRLRCVTEWHPELLLETFQEDDTPSCSLAEALERQSLFVNQTLSAHALALLWNLFREGKIKHCGGYLNLNTGEVRSIPVRAVK